MLSDENKLRIFTGNANPDLHAKSLLTSEPLLVIL